MITDPVAPSGAHGGSNSRNQVSPLASLAVKPGCEPDVFSLNSTHFDGSGGAPTCGPRVISSAEIGRAPMRLVNQFESGTSPIVLMFCARKPLDSRPELTNKLNINSYICDCS